jgi:hypothetical protein
MHGRIVCAFNLIYHPPKNSHTFFLLLIPKPTLEMRVSSGKYIQSHFRIVRSGHQPTLALREKC